MKSKFLYQDVDVVSLAGKSIVVRCFVCKNYDKVPMETGKFWDNIRVNKNGLVSGVDKILKSSDSAFKHITDRLNPLRKSVKFDIFFLRPTSSVRFACIHDNTKVLVPWKWDYPIISLYFGPLRKRPRSFSFRTILRSPVTIWPHEAWRNAEQEQKQGKGFWKRLWKSICCRLVL